MYLGGGKNPDVLSSLVNRPDLVFSLSKCPMLSSESSLIPGYLKVNAAVKGGHTISEPKRGRRQRARKAIKAKQCGVGGVNADDRCC